MNIGIVCYPTFWGSGIVATELGQALAAKWHQVHFIAYNQPVRLDVLAENIFYHEVNVSHYPLFAHPPYQSTLTSKIVDVAQHEKLDILHVHYAIPHASAAYMAQQILKTKGIDLPFITTLHGTDITLVGKDESFEPIISFSINQSTAITAVSESLKQDTYKYFDTTRDIHVIPNFVNLEEYDVPECAEIKQKYAPNGERILVHTSNFREVKRIDDIIKIFAIVQKKIPAKLILVGEGPERNTLEKMAKDMDLVEHIHFLWSITNPEKLLKACDLFLLPSENESFGLAALEAMAAQVPVVSSNTGGIPEVNLQWFSWFLSDVWDVEDMAKNALIILQDDATLAKFKAQAYQQAQKFSIEKIIPLYEDLYKATLLSSQN